MSLFNYDADFPRTINSRTFPPSTAIPIASDNPVFKCPVVFIDGFRTCLLPPVLKQRLARKAVVRAVAPVRIDAKPLLAPSRYARPIPPSLITRTALPLSKAQQLFREITAECSWGSLVLPLTDERGDEWNDPPDIVIGPRRPSPLRSPPVIKRRPNVVIERNVSGSASPEVCATPTSTWYSALSHLDPSARRATILKALGASYARFADHKVLDNFLDRIYVHSIRATEGVGQSLRSFRNQYKALVNTERLSSPLSWVDPKRRAIELRVLRDTRSAIPQSGLAVAFGALKTAAMALGTIAVLRGGKKVVDKVNEVADEATGILGTMKKCLTSVLSGLKKTLGVGLWFVPLVIISCFLINHFIPTIAMRRLFIAALLSLLAAYLSVKAMRAMNKFFSTPGLIDENEFHSMEADSVAQGAASFAFPLVFGAAMATLFSSINPKSGNIDPSTFTRNMPAFSRTVQGWEMVTSWVTKLVENLINFFSVRFFGKTFKFGKNTVIDTWCEEVDKILVKYNAGERSATMADTLIALYEQGVGYAKYVDDESYRERIKSRVLNLIAPVRTFAYVFNARGGTRIEPIMICFTGDPGQGKTLFMSQLCSTIAIAGGYAQGVVEPSDLMFSAATGSQYYDGYVGQFGYLIDDFLQATEKPGANKNSIAEIINFVSTQPHQLNMAVAELKGKTFFTSPLVLATTNLPSFKAITEQLIHENGALERRIKYGVSLRVKPEFSLDDKLDHEKYCVEVEKAAANGTTVYDIYPWHMWEIAKHNFFSEETNAQQPWTSCRDFVEVVSLEIKRRRLVHERNSSTAKDVFAKMQALQDEVDNPGRLIPITNAVHSIRYPQESNDIPLCASTVIPNAQLARSDQPLVLFPSDPFAQGLPKLSASAQCIRAPTQRWNPFFRKELVELEVKAGATVTPEIEAWAEKSVGRMDLDTYEEIVGHQTVDERVNAVKFTTCGTVSAISSCMKLHSAFYAAAARHYIHKDEKRDNIHCRGVATIIMLKWLATPFAELTVSPEAADALVAAFHDDTSYYVKNITTGRTPFEDLLFFYSSNGKYVVKDREGEPTLEVAAGAPRWVKHLKRGVMVVAALTVLAVLFNGMWGMFRSLFGARMKEATTQMRTETLPSSDGAFIPVEGPVNTILGNTYKVCLTIPGSTKVDALGSGFFLYDRVFLMPLHFRKTIEDHYLQYPDCDIKLASVVDNKVKVFSMDEFRAFKTHEVPGNDVWCINMTIKDLPEGSKAKGVEPHAHIKRLMSMHTMRQMVSGAEVNCHITNVLNQGVLSWPYKDKILSGQVSGFSRRTYDSNLGELTFAIDTTYKANAGDCGAPVLLHNTTRTSGVHLLGFHVAADKTSGRGIVAPITADLMESIQRVFPIDKQVVRAADKDLGPLELKDATAQVFDKEFGSQIRYLGSWRLKIPSNPVVKIVQTPLFNKILGKDTRIPIKLTPFVNSEGERINPYNNALRNYAKDIPIEDIDDTVHDACGSEAWSKIQDLTKYESRAMFTFEEAILGVPGIMSGIPRDTAAGFPYNLVGSGKKAVLGNDANIDFDSVEMLLLRARVSYLEECYSKGERPDVYYMDFLKHEVREEEKVMAGKARLVSACPIDYLVLWRMYFGAYMNAVVKHSPNTGVAVGINVYTSWSRVVGFLGETSIDNCFDGDFSAYDASLRPGPFKFMAKWINSWFGDEKYNQDVRIHMFEDLYNSRHAGQSDVDGRFTPLYEMLRSLPSGHPFTSIANSMYCLYIFSVAHYRITGSIRFWDNARLVSYGDDNLTSVNNKIKDVFTLEAISKVLKDEFGMTLTRADKLVGQELCAARNITECTFLKRGFRYEAGEWRAPLELMSVVGGLNWTSHAGGFENPALLEQIRSVSDTFPMELSLHPPKVWDEVYPRFAGVLRETLSYIPIYNTRDAALKRTRALSVDYEKGYIRSQDI
jgi:hypothetical protein